MVRCSCEVTDELHTHQSLLVFTFFLIFFSLQLDLATLCSLISQSWAQVTFPTFSSLPGCVLFLSVSNDMFC